LWEEWVLGFVSGANIYDDSPEMLKQMDEHAIFAWVDDYCRTHPVELVDDAAFELIQELLRRTEKQIILDGEVRRIAVNIVKLPSLLRQQ
jgi:hypothetical protein